MPRILSFLRKFGPPKLQACNSFYKCHMWSSTWWSSLHENHPSPSSPLLLLLISEKTRQVSSTLQHALVSMLVTSVTTAAGDIAIINQLYVHIYFYIYISIINQLYVHVLCDHLEYVCSNWPQSSSDLCFGSQQHYSLCNLAQYYQSHYLEKEISRETLKRGSKLFTEGNASSFSQWSHRINHKSSKWHVSAFFGSYVSNITAIKCFRYTTFQFKPTFHFCTFVYLDI